MKQTSKNIILYRGRYIRRLVGPGWPKEAFIVTWIRTPGLMDPNDLLAEQSEVGYCNLAVLLATIKQDDEFYGFQRWLI